MEKFICNGKLNLYLYVLNKRADGYHEIESLMSEIEYGDELFIDIKMSFIVAILHSYRTTWWQEPSICFDR